MNFRSIFYGTLLGAAILVVVLCITSCGPDWIVPQGPSVNPPSQPSGPTDPGNPPVVDGGDNNPPDDQPCDGGQPLPDPDGGTTDGGHDGGHDGGSGSDAGTPPCDGGTGGGDDGGTHCRWSDDDHHEKECCKNGYGWGDKNHCHIHKDNGNH